MQAALIPLNFRSSKYNRKSLKIVDKLVIGILVNNKKNYWFSLEEREAMIKKSLNLMTI